MRLRRFSVTNCVLFTIRTYVAPIPVVARDADVSRRLADTVASLPGDVRSYKDVVTSAEALIRRLRGNGREVDTLALKNIE